MELGIDVDATDNRDRTALQSIIEDNWPEGQNATKICKRLLSLGADSNRICADGESLLIKATKHNQLGVVSALISHGALLNTKDPYGDMALHIAVKTEAARITRRLVAAGADKDAEGAYGHRPIHLAATLSGTSKIMEALDGCDIDARANSPYGNMTALMLAANEGKIRNLNNLIKIGADLNLTDELGYTATAFAARWPSSKMLESLISKGAEINTSDHIGWTPLHWAAQTAGLRNVTMLLNAGADPDAQTDDGLTALHIAVENDEYKLVEKLIESGANPNVADAHGATPLHWAASSEVPRDHVYNLLLHGGADRTLQDDSGMTAPERRKASMLYHSFTPFPVQ